MVMCLPVGGELSDIFISAPTTAGVTIPAAAKEDEEEMLVEEVGRPKSGVMRKRGGRGPRLTKVMWNLFFIFQ